MQYLYLGGFAASMLLAGFARSDKNYGEMRALLMTSLLFFSLWLEKFWN
jgi:hypothetical protein